MPTPWEIIQGNVGGGAPSVGGGTAWDLISPNIHLPEAPEIVEDPGPQYKQFTSRASSAQDIIDQVTGGYARPQPQEGYISPIQREQPEQTGFFEGVGDFFAENKTPWDFISNTLQRGRQEDQMRFTVGEGLSPERAQVAQETVRQPVTYYQSPQQATTQFLTEGIASPLKTVISVYKGMRSDENPYLPSSRFGQQFFGGEIQPYTKTAEEAIEMAGALRGQDDPTVGSAVLGSSGMAFLTTLDFTGVGGKSKGVKTVAKAIAKTKKLDDITDLTRQIIKTGDDDTITAVARSLQNVDDEAQVIRQLQNIQLAKSAQQSPATFTSNFTRQDAELSLFGVNDGDVVTMNPRKLSNNQVTPETDVLEKLSRKPYDVTLQDGKFVIDDPYRS